MLTNYRFQALPLSPALCADHLESVFLSQASSLGHLALISSLLAVTPAPASTVSSAKWG